MQGGERFRVDRMAVMVFTIAICARLLHVLAMRESVFFDHLLVDSVDFDARATAFLRGGPSEGGAFYQAPLYPMFLSLLYLVFGHDLLAVRLVQALMGSASAVVVYLIGRRCCGRTAGVVAGLLYSLYAMVIHFDAEILRPSLVVFLSLCSVYLLLAAAPRPGYWRWGAAGVSLGLASIARPTVLLFLPPAAVWAVFAAAGRGKSVPGPRAAARGLAAALVFASLTLVPVALVTYVNYAKSGAFVPISYNGGINFYIGNNQDYDRTVGIRPGIRWDLLTSEPSADRRTDPGGWSDYYYEKAKSYITSDTRGYLALLVKKFVLFWNGHEIERNTSFAHVAEHSPLFAYPVVSFRWVAPLAIVGLIVALRRRPPLGLPALFLFSQMTATVAFFVCARYRMTSVPFLCLFAAYAIVTIVAMFRRRERAAWAYLTLAVLAGVGVNLDAYAISQQRYSRPYYERAMIFRREGKTDAAIESFNRASREQPEDPDVLFQWGVTLAGRGNYEGAAKLFEDAARAEPRYSKSWFNLGLSLSRIEQTASAAVAYRKALEVDPSYWEAAVGLGDALIEEGARDEAAEAYRRSMELARTRREAAVSGMSLGRAEAMRGRYAESLEHFEGVLSAFPGSVDARIAKARVLLALGRVEEAAAEARIAARADTSDVRVKALLKDLGIGERDQRPAEPRGDIN